MEGDDLDFWQLELDWLRSETDAQVGDAAAALHAAWPRSRQQRAVFRAKFPDEAQCRLAWVSGVVPLLLGGELRGVRLAGWSFARRAAFDEVDADDEDAASVHSQAAATAGSESSSSEQGAFEALTLGSEHRKSLSSEEGDRSDGQSASPRSSLGQASNPDANSPAGSIAKGPQGGDHGNVNVKAVLWVCSDGGGRGVHLRVGHFLRMVARERSRVIQDLRRAWMQGV
jgi:hypothetical protein